MIPWESLSAELDAWAQTGLAATFWWRDDDASTWTPALARLLALSRDLGVPVALAVIPQRLAPELAEHLQGAAEVSVLQHGFSHDDHAGAGEKKAELGDHRSRRLVLDELYRGRSILKQAFGPRFHAVLVPPWNRISPAIRAALSTDDWNGLSTFGPRAAPCLSSGLPVCNTHLDIVHWRGGRGFVGLEAAIGQVVTHLRGRRSGTLDVLEPTGLLTHHLDHDPRCWRFCGEFLRRTRDHPAVEWLDGHGALAAG